MFRRGDHGPLTHFLAAVAGVATLVWIGHLWVSLAREALSEPKAQDVQIVNASSLVVTPDISVSWRNSSVKAEYTFIIDGVQHSGTRLFPNKDGRVKMTAASANELAAAILRDGTVRVPHNDPAQAFLAYRTAASWVIYFLTYSAAAIFIFIATLSNFIIARSKWTKKKSEAEQRRTSVDTSVVRRDS